MTEQTELYWATLDGRVARADLATQQAKDAGGRRAVVYAARAKR